MAAMPVETEPTAYVQEETEVDPYAGFEPMKEDEGSDQFNVDLGFIEGELIKKSEEEAVGLTSVVPFLVEDMLKEKGGHYSRGDDWTPHIVVDGNLITGQNPASSEGAAKAVLQALED